MFIKITTSGKYQYAQLVESYREKGKIRHRVILNLGRVDQIQHNPSFQNLAVKLAELSAVHGSTHPIEESSEAEIFNYGYLAYRRLWEQFGLPELLAGLAGNSRFDLERSTFLMAVQHLLDPRSKRGTHERQERYYALPPLKLHHLYRTLDKLAHAKEKLEEELFQRNRTLFNLKVDVVFFDVTTFHFESVRRDSLRDFGFSKEGKHKEVQVVCCLLVDQSGRPVGYELFPGHTFEGNTLESALDSLEQRFGIQRVIIVADRGINSKLNLCSIRRKGYGYILASRLKQMPRPVLARALDTAGYQEVNREEETFRFKVLTHTNRFREDGTWHALPEKLIVTYSAKRAEKDRCDRERLIAKARLLLKNTGRINASFKRGGKRYLTQSERSAPQWVLDEKKIADDERFDGYYAIQTSEDNLSAPAVIDTYHQLWKIEECFRVMKSTLEVCPVFHWTETRIKGHFVLCFLAFLLERTLEWKLAEGGYDSSPQRIREALNSLNFVAVTVHRKRFLIKTKAPTLAHDIWRLLRLRPPKNVTPQEEMHLTV